MRFRLASWLRALGINSSGQAVGEYTDAQGVIHGFLFSQGHYLTLDDSTAGAKETQALGINNQGQVVGIYFDANNNWHLFEATPNFG
jgi:probable HAF family extracellular repeat protein